MAWVIIVCGSREYSNRDMINRVLDAELAKRGPQMRVRIGGATGADELTRQWAVSRKVDHDVRYARWDTEGKIAGPNRNRRLLKKKVREVFAFRVSGPGKNRGTDNMISLAEAAKVRVKRFF